MKRTEWGITMPTTQLIEAAQSNIDHIRKEREEMRLRIAKWNDQVLKDIEEERKKNLPWPQRGAHYRAQYHDPLWGEDKIKEYEKQIRLLKKIDGSLALDAEDYTFFFPREPTMPETTDEQRQPNTP